jgi:hypothetical protein
MINLRHELEMIAKGSPWLLRTAWQLRKPLSAMRLIGPTFFRRRLVERGYDVVIDGFPRSANSFACDAFVVAQGHSVADATTKGYAIKIANHVHAPAQFMLAKKYGVPAMLVLREPVAAALSWLVYTHERDAASAWMHGYDGQGAAKLVLRDYIRFHRPLLAIRDAFVVAPFDEVTSDFGQSIERLNHRFGTSFSPFDHTKQSEAAIFQVMRDRVEDRSKRLGVDLARTFHFPDEQKRAMRDRLAAELDTEELAPLRTAATALYLELMATV